VSQGVGGRANNACIARGTGEGRLKKGHVAAVLMFYGRVLRREEGYLLPSSTWGSATRANMPNLQYNPCFGG